MRKCHNITNQFSFFRRSQGSSGFNLFDKHRKQKNKNDDTISGDSPVRANKHDESNN